jgi:hypothetical protein
MMCIILFSFSSLIAIAASNTKVFIHVSGFICKLYFNPFLRMNISSVAKYTSFANRVELVITYLKSKDYQGTSSFFLLC